MKNRAYPPARGFSLMELVVVIALVLLLALSVVWVASKIRQAVLGLKGKAEGTESPQTPKTPTEPDPK